MAGRPIERFERRRWLGEGGMGVVHLAYDHQRRAEVAVKTLNRTEARDIYRLKREFRRLAGVTHRNLVTLYDLVHAGDAWLFTMEYVRGVDFLAWVRGASADGPDHAPTLEALPPDTTAGSLGPDRALDPAAADLVALAEPPRRTLGPLDEARLRGALAQLVEAVVALHRAGKVHRDLKPSNVLVEPGGRLVVLDFGLAVDHQPDAAESHDPTAVGTPAYMAPEQVNPASVGPAADWYAVGCMLYEALAGQLPFTGPPLKVVVDKKLGRRPPRPVDVPADLADLAMALLEPDPGRRPTGEQLLQQLARPATALALTGPLPTIVDHGPAVLGRDAELDVLWAHLAATHDGRPRCLFLGGPSGMGKTTLLRAFGDVVRRDGGVVLDGRAFEHEAVPFRAVDGVVDLLSHLVKEAPELADSLTGREADALVRVFPVLGRVDAVADRRRSATAAERGGDALQAAFEGIRALLAALATERPVVVLLDDLQWSDADSARLVEALLGPPAPAVLWVGAGREDEAVTSPLWGVFQSARRVTLGPLADREARRLAGRLLGPAARPALVRGVVDEAAGSPFLVVELVRHILALGTVPLTPTIEAVVAARAAALPAAAAALLQVVVVAGRPTPRRVALRAADTPDDGQKALAVLRGEHLVRVRGSGEQSAVEPYHDRLRRALLGTLSPARQRAVHARLAAAWRVEGAEDCEALATHLEGAGDGAGAARAYVHAARRAADSLAFAHAASLYAKARRADPRAAGALRRPNADALAAAGRGPEAAALMLEEAAAGGPDAAPLQRQAAELLLLSGHFADGLRVLRDVLAAVGEVYPASAAEALAAVAGGVSPDLEVARPQPGTAAQRTRIDACYAAAMGHLLVDPARSAYFQSRNLRLTVQAGDQRQAARALAVQAGQLALFGGAARAADVERLLERARAHLGDAPPPHFELMWLIAAASAEGNLGRWQRSEAQADRAARLLRAHLPTAWWERDMVAVAGLQAARFRGDLTGVERRARILGRDAEVRGDVLALTFVAGWVGERAFFDGRPDEAVRPLRAALARWWAGVGYTLHHWVADALEVQVRLAGGDVAGASAKLAEALARAEDAGLLGAEKRRLLAYWLRGRVALAAGDRAAACADAERIEARGAPWALGYAWALRAAAQPDDAQAAAGLTAAARAFADADMALDAAACQLQSGLLEGGDAGAERATAGHEALQVRGVADPRLWAWLIAPR